jgi:hypothetical protein
MMQKKKARCHWLKVDSSLGRNADPERYVSDYTGSVLPWSGKSGAVISITIP